MRVSVTSSEVEGGDVCIHYKMLEAVLVYSADEGHIIKGVSLCQDCILTILTPQNRHFQFSHIFFFAIYEYVLLLWLQTFRTGLWDIELRLCWISFGFGVLFLPSQKAAPNCKASSRLSFPIWWKKDEAVASVPPYRLHGNVCWSLSVCQCLIHVNIKLQCSVPAFPSLDIWPFGFFFLLTHFIFRALLGSQQNWVEAFSFCKLWFFFPLRLLCCLDCAFCPHSFLCAVPSQIPAKFLCSQLSYTLYLWLQTI